MHMFIFLSLIGRIVQGQIIDQAAMLGQTFSMIFSKLKKFVIIFLVKLETPQFGLLYSSPIMLKWRWTES